jgi:SAM-dependent methyltransferase
MTEPANDSHYGAGDLVARVAAALHQAGFGDGAIAWSELAPLDQFHVGGEPATAALAEKLHIPPGAKLLDVGCGLGGPARHLASVYGCSVVGVDLSQPFVDLATMLTERSGLPVRVRHQVADATRLPFEPQSFDLAWTQHVAMNIADRRALYSGVFRALRPGGRFAMYDVVAGEGGELRFPVPWARDPAASFLMSPAATRAVLESVGFVVLDWTDATEAGLAWSEAQAAARQTRPEHLRPLALPLVMGPEFPAMTANMARNLRERRTGLLQAVVQRPA